MAIQDSRILIKRSTTTGVVPTVPASNDHTDGTWIATDIYKGELFFNQADGVMFTRDDSGIVTVGGKSDSALYSASLTIASADVLQLNSTPLTIVSAQGVGTAIEVISASVKMVYNSVAYATNTTLELKMSGANTNLATLTNSLAATVESHKYLNISGTGTATATQIIENADLQVSVSIGDPTAGDSDITVYVLYRVITV